MLTINDNHEYYLDDKRIPGVNEILKDLGFIRYTSGGDHVEAMEYGSLFHQITAYHDAGILETEMIPAHMVADYLAYVSWLEQMNVEVLSVEEMLHADSYAGTLDRRVKIGDKLFVLDIKTGAEQPWHRLQLTAYQLMLDPGYRRAALYIKGGVAKFKDLSNARMFLDAEDQQLWNKSVEMWGILCGYSSEV